MTLEDLILSYGEGTRRAVQDPDYETCCYGSLRVTIKDFCRRWDVEDILEERWFKDIKTLPVDWFDITDGVLVISLKLPGMKKRKK